VKDKAKLLRAYQVMAEAGNGDAQHDLGMRYLRGEGVPINRAEGIQWLRRAAGQQHAAAMFELARLALEDGGEAEAGKLLLSAAEQGHPGAQYQYATLRAAGKFGAMDDAEVNQWLQAAAEQGHVEAQLMLASRIAGRDQTTAIEWYRKAAERGNPQAQHAYAMGLAAGKSGTADMAEVANWLQKAADQGYAPAQAQLGLLFLEGKGVAQDFVKAHMWLNLAAAQGDATGASRREELNSKMTREQVAQAQDLARDWRPTKTVK
jgi:TPR repeat protein